MKKKLLVLLLLSFAASSMYAQSYCGSSRYDSEVFSNVTVTSNIIYGSNTTFSGSIDTLKMDIYQPTGDTAAKRPFIVFAHGGSFIGGSKTDVDQVTLCNAFAKRGYVTASIDYRLGFYPIDSTNAKGALWRAMQDMKAAMRFFRKDASTANLYKTDTNMYFAGGYSAGSFMAIHLAYLKPSEIPTGIDTVTLGGLEGNSGNPGYSSKVNGVINLSGAIGDTSWINAGDVPMVTLQGNSDNTVPYCTQLLYVAGIPIIVVSGGGSMHIREVNLGINNPIHTFYGEDHCAPVGASGCPAANIDTSILLASDFLYRYMGCNPASTVDYTNHPTCVTVQGVSEYHSSEGIINIYPVPATDAVKVAFDNSSKISAELFDLSGRRIETYTPNEKEFFINRNDKDAGVYFLKVTTETGATQMAKIIWTN
jgi:hypothetical protein